MICGHWTTPHDYKTTSKGWDHNRPYHRLRRISHLQSHKVFPRIWRLSLSSPPSSSFASCNPPSHHQEHLFISPIANISPLWTIGVTGMGGVGSCHTVGLSKNIYKIYNIPTPPSPPFLQCFFFIFKVIYLPDVQFHTTWAIVASPGVLWASWRRIRLPSPRFSQ